MRKFQEFVPEASKITTTAACWADVELAVQDVQSQWNTKVKESHFGRTKQWLRKMCDGLNNHSSAMKLLPSESVYTSLVAGSVTMILKVSSRLYELQS